VEFSFQDCQLGEVGQLGALFFRHRGKRRLSKLPFDSPVISCVDRHGEIVLSKRDLVIFVDAIVFLED
jgi:hypothetical protein